MEDSDNSVEMSYSAAAAAVQLLLSLLFYSVGGTPFSV